MTANDNRSYLSYLNKLLDQKNDTYHSINKKPITAENSTLTKKLRWILKLLNLKLIRITKHKNIFSKAYTEKMVKRNIYYSVLKTNPWTHKIKDLSGEKLLGSLYER